MKESTKLAIIIALYILIGSSIVALFLMKMQSFTINDNMEMYSLGQLDRPGYVGIELYYDKEPVDIHLISPDERLVYKQFADIYLVDEETKKITFLTDTDKVGLWKVEFNKKFQYSILAYKDGYSIPLSNEIVDINQPCMVKLELPDNMYDGNVYRLRVCCMMLDNIDNYDFKEVKIQTENITTSESSEESNSEQDTSDETE